MKVKEICGFPVLEYDYKPNTYNLNTLEAEGFA